MTGMRRPLVAAFLGTDHHPFDRLVAWAEHLKQQGWTDWYVQHGATELPPTLRGSRLMGLGEMSDLLALADVVVTHGGPGLIMDARTAGHLPIVVPRDPAFDEHVDDHQLRFAARMADSGNVRLARTLDQLESHVRTVVDERRLLGNAPGRVDLRTTTEARDVAERFGRLVEQLIHQ